MPLSGAGRAGYSVSGDPLDQPIKGAAGGGYKLDDIDMSDPNADPNGGLLIVEDFTKSKKVRAPPARFAQKTLPKKEETKVEENGDVVMEQPAKRKPAAAKKAWVAPDAADLDEQPQKQEELHQAEATKDGADEIPLSGGGKGYNLDNIDDVPLGGGGYKLDSLDDMPVGGNRGTG
jgi:hypothetical protein